MAAGPDLPWLRRKCQPRLAREIHPASSIYLERPTKTPGEGLANFLRFPQIGETIFANGGVTPILWSRLGCHGATYRKTCGRRFRRGTCRTDVRMDCRIPSDWSASSSMACGYLAEPRPVITRSLSFCPGCSVFWQRSLPLSSDRDQSEICSPSPRKVLGEKRT
jgi:hypothetical protein